MRNDSAKAFSRRDFCKTIGWGLFAGLMPGCTRIRRRKPNLVFILIDDLGWTDPGCYGSRFYETPAIDRLAAEGMRFTDAYAASPVCSPTRASILTGKHPARLHITDWIPGLDPKNRLLIGPEDIHDLPLAEKTIAEVLRDADYTTAFFGKWHLGYEGHAPEDQGFDLNKGGHWAGQPADYFYPYKNERKRWDVPGLADGEEGEYLTDRLTDEALRFIEGNRKRPFFLFLSHYAVHTPIQSQPDLEEKYRTKRLKLTIPDRQEMRAERRSMSKQVQDDPAYAGMVQSVDESVGRILETLEVLGLEEQTVIFFMSDNGGLSTLPQGWKSPTSVYPLRAGKGWLYEGGIRVPLIVKWPGRTPPGTECRTMVTSMDFFPTMLEMAGLDTFDPHPDGASLVPLLTQTGKHDREALYWHFPHYHGSGHTPAGAVRAGEYKLIEWFEDRSIELYDLNSDIGERVNLVDAYPEKAEALRKKLEEWRMRVGADMPKPNPRQ